MTSQSAIRAGLLARVSKTSEESVPRQQAASERICAERGWQVVDRYSMEAQSASRFATKGRPEWLRLQKDIEADRLDVVVIREASRASREVDDWAAFLTRCRKHKVRLYVRFDDQLYDPAVARHRKELLVEGADAEYESEKTSSRVLEGLAAAAADGRPHSSAPYGYVRRYSPDTRAFIEQVPVEPQASIVREIISRVGRGEPVMQIVRDLNERGIAAPAGTAPWNPRAVRRIALNIAYAGQRRHRETITQGLWDAVVTDDEMAAANRVLTQRMDKSQPGTLRHLASYLATCAKCGAPMRKARDKKIGDIYVCWAHGCARMEKEKLDGMITALVLAGLGSKHWRSQFLAPDDSQLAAARDEADELRRRQRDLAEDITEGRIDRAVAAMASTALAAKVAAADQRVKELSVPSILREFTGDDPVPVVWEATPLPVKREIIRAIFSAIRVQPARAGGDVEFVLHKEILPIPSGGPR